MFNERAVREVFAGSVDPRLLLGSPEHTRLASFNPLARQRFIVSLRAGCCVWLHDGRADQPLSKTYTRPLPLKLEMKQRGMNRPLKAPRNRVHVIVHNALGVGTRQDDIQMP